jgi:phosphate transport system substrate-binding protein
LNLRKYWINTTLWALIGSPIIVSIGLIVVSFPIIAITASKHNSLPTFLLLIFPPLILLAFVWFFYAKRTPLPDNGFQVFLPIIVVFSYYMLVWILVFGLSNYHFDDRLFSFLSVYGIATMPYLAINFLFAFGGDYNQFPLLQVAITLITVIAILISCVINKKHIKFEKNVFAYVVLFVLLSSIAAFQYFDRTSKVLADDHKVERVSDEVNLNDYRPFRDKNKLVKLADVPTVSIGDSYPKLDGATAAYPVYGGMAQALYKGLDSKTIGNYVQCTKTNEAYERLIKGEIDVFFGAQPSKQQLEMAKSKGVDFVLTPIAREAFVFFVNKDNPVSSLTIEQIQNIYQKKITNWNELGGKNEKIMPFQRPENSGSQTIMLAKVMSGNELPPPLWEEYAAGMGGVISKVATYRNYSSAIGYSFRYFATGMKSNENIKLLAINGTAPTIENIQNGSYLFTIDVYAVTTQFSTGNTKKLIDWILSDQGQNFIAECGYVRQK